MQRRFYRWGLLAVLLLFVSSAVGIVVRGVIKPHRDDSYYNGYSRGYTVKSSGTMVLPDTIAPGPQPFSSPRPPLPAEKRDLASPIEDLQRSFANSPPGNPLPIADEFDIDRMTEEWCRFGVNEFRERPVPQTQDAATLRRRISLARNYCASSLRPSNVEIVWVAASSLGNDRMVLAKHTAIENGAKNTWYTRWWLTSRYSQWRIYDFEVQPHRLRFNALLAAEQTVRYRGFSDKQPEEADRERLVQDLCDEFTSMLAHTEDRIVYLLKTNSASAAYEYIPPLEVCREYVDDEMNWQQPERLPRLRDSLRKWPDSPVSRFIDDGQADTWDIYKNHPAAIVRQSRRQGNSVAILRSGLAEMPGQPELLAELFRMLPAGERAEIGELAARGVDPSGSLRRIFQENIYDPARHGELQKCIDAFRAVRPREAVSLVGAAVLAAARGKTDAAAKLLATAFDGATAAEIDFQMALYCSLAIDSHCEIAAYQAAALAKCGPNAIRYYAFELGDEDSKSLAKLVEADEKSANNISYRFMKARLLQSRQKYEEADRILLKCLENISPQNRIVLTNNNPERSKISYERLLALPPDDSPGGYERLRAARTLGLYKLGRAKEALDQLKPFDATFEQLLQMHLEGKQYAELRDLIVHCQREFDAESHADFWRGRLAFAEQRYPDAIHYYEKCAKAKLSREDMQILVEQLVRSCFRTGLGNALTAAKRYYDGSDTAMILLAASALQYYDRITAQKILNIFKQIHWQDYRRLIGNDPDLGPLLSRPENQILLGD